MSNARSHWDEVWSRGTRGGSPDSRRALSAALRKAFLPAGSPPNYFLRSWLATHVDLSDKTVLEVGGTGGLGVILARHCREYALLDYSAEAAAQAGRTLARVRNARVIHGDMFEYQPPEPFDLVMSLGLIEHFFGAARDACFRQHVRMSRSYICVGAPSDTPTNWWRHFRFAGTGDYPDQRPVSERELFDLTLEAGLHPLAMTRLDPLYGRIRSRFVRLTWSWIAAALPLRRYALDRPGGGIVVMLAKHKDGDPGGSAPSDSL